MSVKVKICGITNLPDAEAALQAGADYLGFIFYPPSKRAVTEPVAKEIARALRGRSHCPLLVGVFVNESAGEIDRLLSECDLDLAQLSGDEVPSLVADPASPLFGRAYKSIRPASITEAEAEAEWYAVPERPPYLPSLLIDTLHPQLRGGTGQTGDWRLSARIAAAWPGLMLAGGLTVHNVSAAVAQVRPFAVDVASGVEAAPGKKDHEQVRRFIASAKRASL